MTTEVALKVSKKYESVRLYLHWPNVPTLTLLETPQQQIEKNATGKPETSPQAQTD